MAATFTTVVSTRRRPLDVSRQRSLPGRLGRPHTHSLASPAWQCSCT